MIPDKTNMLMEFYRYRTGSGELRCHRFYIPGCKTGELILNIPDKENALSIEAIFIERRFRKSGIGTMFLEFAERMACEMGLNFVELRPFSTDPFVSDRELRDWYSKRGYLPDGDKMRKNIINNFEVMT